MRQIVPVHLGARSYDIHIGPGVLNDAAALLADIRLPKTPVIVTDDHVAKYHLPQLQAALGGAEAIVIPHGEKSKSWASLEMLVERLLALGVERKDHVIALGGGMIGDLVGFATSLTRRGCGFVQIPTSLLAQVDSSVGGKTAINAAAGKNLVGAFHQPARVLIDPALLKSLPDRELRAGYAEVVKYGLINDAGFFQWCDANVEKIMARDMEALVTAIETSCRAKAAVVAADEREETGLRALLNLGHTFGHALEAETGYSDRLLHGEAVAIGMALAFRYSAHRGHCDAAEAQHVVAHLARAGLPVHPHAAGINAGADHLIAHMLQDKKMSAGNLPFILARGIGQSYLAQDVALSDVQSFLSDVLAEDN